MDEKEDFIKIRCNKCGKEYMGPKPTYCCNGDMCGCMGMPIDPDSVYCDECLGDLFKKK